MNDNKIATPRGTAARQPSTETSKLLPSTTSTTTTATSTTSGSITPRMKSGGSMTPRGATAASSGATTPRNRISSGTSIAAPPTLTKSASVSSLTSGVSASGNLKPPKVPRIQISSTQISTEAINQQQETSLEENELQEQNNATAVEIGTSATSRVDIKKRKADIAARVGEHASDTVKALMEKKMSKMKEQVLKQQSLKEEEREKEMQMIKIQNEKTILELTEKIAETALKFKSAEEQLNTMKRQFEIQIEELQLQLESANLDKEIAEQELEDLKTSIAQQQDAFFNQMNQTTNSTDDKEIQVENVKMKQIITAMRDSQIKDRQQLQDSLDQLSYSKNRIKELDAQVVFLQNKIDSLEETIQELREHVIIAQSSEDIIESLTEKNLLLGEKVAQLEKSVEEYEEFKTIHSEVEHYNDELIKSLREDLLRREEEVEKWEQELQATKDMLKERDTIIGRFRIKVIELTREVTMLKNQRGNEESQMQEIKAKSQTLLRTYHILQEKLKKMKSMAIEQDIQTALMKNNDHFLETIQQLFPKKVLNEDVRALQSLRVIDILQFKLEVIIQTILEEKTARSGLPLEKPEGDNSSTSSQPESVMEFSTHSCFLSYLSFFLYMSLYMIGNFKNSNLTDVNKLVRMGRFLVELKEADRSLDSIIQIVKQADLNEDNVTSLLKPLVDHLERVCMPGTPNIQTVTWGSLSHAIIAVTNMCQESLDMLGLIQHLCETVISEQERSQVNKNQLRDFFAILRQDKEEFMQLVQLYRKLHRLSVEHKNHIIQRDLSVLLHKCLIFGVLSFEVSRLRLEKVQKVCQEKEWQLINSTFDRLSRELSEPVDLGELKIYQNLEDNPLTHSLSLCALVLNIPEKIVFDMVDLVGSTQEFMVSQLMQDVSASLNNLCDFLSRSEYVSNDSLEKLLITKRTEEVSERLGSYETLTLRLEESEAEILRINKRKAEMEMRLEDMQKMKESVEQSLRELQKKDREFAQMEDKMKQMEELNRELEVTRLNEIQYQSSIFDLKLQIETLEQRNYVLQQQLLGIHKTPSSHKEKIVSLEDANLGAIDYVDRTELLALKSSLRIMRSNHFKERAYEDERRMRKIVSRTHCLTSLPNVPYLSQLCRFSKNMANKPPHRIIFPVIDMVNTKEKGSVDYQWNKHCSSYYALQSQFTTSFCE